MYKKLARQYHPDMNVNVPDYLVKLVEEKFKKVNEAMDLIRIELRKYEKEIMETEYKKGMEYYRKKEYVEAIKHLIKAGKLGNKEAQFCLGVCYDQGYGTTKDYNQAFYWYEKAAKQGHIEAQCKLGEFYEDGKEVKKDYDIALSWYKMAADKGKIEGKYGLAKCYYESKDKANRKKAETLFKELAEQDYRNSKSYLRKCQFKNIFF